MSSGGMRILADTLRALGFASITTAPTAIGTAFDHPVRLLSIKNDTNQPVAISYDGANIQEYIPAKTGIVLDFTSNSGATVFPLMSAGTTVYVSYITIAPTSGIVTVSAYYCVGD